MGGILESLHGIARGSLSGAVIARVGTLLVSSALSACARSVPAAAQPAAVRTASTDEDMSSTPPANDADAAAGASPVALRCTGRATEDLAQAIPIALGKARACYNHALATNPKLTGHMHLKIRIEQDGTVSESHVLASDLAAELDECVLQTLEKPTYPAPIGGCVDAEIPINFVPAASAPQNP